MFEPTSSGHFEADANLLLDEGVQQATVRLSGDANGSLSIHGGGGCAAGTDLRGGTGLVLAIGLLAPLRRRRRRSAATRSASATRRRRHFPALAAATIAMLMGLRITRADDVVIGVFNPTPATVKTGFQLE